jgi:phosphoribosylanthranilate isomerase
VTWIKICGITNLEDARAAMDAGADAVGFVFWEKSPRPVKVDMVRQITEMLPATVEKVGVFVDDTAAHVLETVQQTGLTAVQLGKLGTLVGLISDPMKKIVSISAENLANGEVLINRDFAKMLFALMIDATTSVQPGGTGRCFDWQRARKKVKELAEMSPTIVAGGLTPQNVGEAIRILSPWGVDVSSGVEASPGRKDHHKIRAFVAAVREAEGRS